MKKEIDFEELYERFDDLYCCALDRQVMLKWIADKERTKVEENVDINADTLEGTISVEEFLGVKPIIQKKLKSLKDEIAIVLGELNQAGLLAEAKKRHYQDWEDDYISEFCKTHEIMF